MEEGERRMSRYIDADKLTDRAYQLNFDKEISERELAIVNRLIAESPTEDVAPVVHAKWVAENNPDYSPFDPTMDSEVYFCSNCYNKQYKMSKYCSNCGAKIDLDKENKHEQ